MKKVCIFLILLGTFTVYAQAPNNSSQPIPSGKYFPERESFQVYKTETGVEYQVNEHNITIASGIAATVEYFTEIEVTGNTIIFKSPTKTVQVNYSNDGTNGIVFENPVEPFERGVSEAGNLLFFMKEIEDPNDKKDPVSVRFVYRLKK